MTFISPRIAQPTILPDKNIKFSVIIPAAGLGHRAKGMGAKPLIKIRNQTSIITNQLKHIRTYLNSDDINVVYGFQQEKMEAQLGNSGVKLIYNNRFETTNVVYSIHLGLQNVKHKNVVIIYGDLVFNTYTLRVPFGSQSAIIYDSGGFMSNGEVGCIIADRKLENMMYDLPQKWAQIVYITGRELDMFKYFCGIEKCWQYFGFEIINAALNNNGVFLAYSPKRMRARDIDVTKDLEDIESVLK